MAVNRCICHDTSFDELLQIARRDSLSADDLKARGLCSGGCGMCEPYIRLMLRTGRTDLPVLSEADIQRLGLRPSRGTDRAPPRPNETPPA